LPSKEAVKTFGRAAEFPIAILKRDIDATVSPIHGLQGLQCPISFVACEWATAGLTGFCTFNYHSVIYIPAEQGLFAQAAILPKVALPGRRKRKRRRYPDIGANRPEGARRA
jgi:hypothetical protein